MASHRYTSPDSVKYIAEDICHEQATCTMVVGECAHLLHNVGLMYDVSSSVESKKRPHVYNLLLTVVVLVLVENEEDASLPSCFTSDVLVLARGETERAKNSARSTMF